MFRSLRFLHTESTAGLLLLVMVPTALFWANGPFGNTYDSVWSIDVGLDFAGYDLALDLRHWVNDGLMTLFFFVVGLEIKREMIDGELREWHRALTPVAAALGGMILPVVIYIAFNIGGSGLRGWGIPMATDIAIVLGVLALLGSRVPLALRTFLLTLAIADDIGAIAVIALFYSDGGIDVGPLAVAIVLLSILRLLDHFDLRRPVIVLVISIAVWLATFESGVHATLAGVALALVTPASRRTSATTDVGSTSVTSSIDRLQRIFHPWSSYLILPLFALANSGIELSSGFLSAAVESPVSVGILVALLFGKPLGIGLATWFAIRVGGALPGGTTLRVVVAASVLAGIGFTVSIFISDLAFTDPTLAAEAKIGVLVASLAAGVIGTSALRIVLRQPGSTTIDN